MKGKTPKLSKAHYWWIIGQLGGWYAVTHGTDLRAFIVSIADSLMDTNPAFDYEKFIGAAFKEYNLTFV